MTPINGFFKDEYQNINLFYTPNSYILKFDLNEGDSATIDDQNILFQGLANSPNNPTRLGYTFKGWNTRDDGSGITWDFNTEKMPLNDVKLYAQWEENIVIINEYKLEFDLNGIDGVIPGTQSLEEGTLGVKPSDPTSSGYTFKGWNTKADGSGIMWDFSIEKIPSNDVTLYAQ